MLVIADSSPLNILIRIQCVQALRQLFDVVYVPPAVIREMSDPDAPEIVRSWAAAPPDWLIVQAPARSNSHADLGRGEGEAIDLAVELHADVLLVDDRLARRHAQRLGIPIMGTIGIIERADSLGLLQLPQAISAIKQSDFRISSQLLDQALDRWNRKHLPS